MHIKVDQNKTKVDLASLAICKEIAKIDAEKLAQREVSVDWLRGVNLQAEVPTNDYLIPFWNSSRSKSSTTKPSNKQSNTFITDSARCPTRHYLD